MEIQIGLGLVWDGGFRPGWPAGRLAQGPGKVGRGRPGAADQQVQSQLVEALGFNAGWGCATVGKPEPYPRSVRMSGNPRHQLLQTRGTDCADCATPMARTDQWRRRCYSAGWEVPNQSAADADPIRCPHYAGKHECHRMVPRRPIPNLTQCHSTNRDRFPKDRQIPPSNLPAVARAVPKGQLAGAALPNRVRTAWRRPAGSALY